MYTIPGVPTNFRRELDLDIVRIATGGTYDDPGRMIGEDGAVSLRIVERRAVREAARYAFNLARRTGKRVTSSSKYTIQKATDGLFEQVAREVAQQFPEVPHGIELFDALLGKVIMAPEKFQIVLVLNEYGDFLSDMACGLAGSLGIGASANLGFDPAAVVRVALFDAAHGTAPDIAGKNLANPTAIFLALSMLLYQLGEISVGKAVKDTTLDLLRQGVRTGDLGGQEIDRDLHRRRRRGGRPAAQPAGSRPLKEFLGRPRGICPPSPARPNSIRAGCVEGRGWVSAQPAALAPSSLSIPRLRLRNARAGGRSPAPCIRRSLGGEARHSAARSPG